MISVTRRYRFSASHRLHSEDLSAAENARLYGKCNNPFGHGHDYILEVSVSGPLSPVNGLLVPVAQLDMLIGDCVLRVIAHRNLNRDVARFANTVPTTENLALFIREVVQRNWRQYLGDSTARLARVHIQETDRNGFEVLLRPALEGTTANA